MTCGRVALAVVVAVVVIVEWEGIHSPYHFSRISNSISRTDNVYCYVHLRMDYMLDHHVLIFMIFHWQHFAFFIHTITTTTTSTLVLVLTPSPQILISIRWLYALSNSLQHCLWKTCPQGVYRHHPFVDIVSKHIASATRIKGKNGIKGKIKGRIKGTYEDSKDMTESGLAAFPVVNFKSRKWCKEYD